MRRRPSMRLRLLVGTGLSVTVVMLISQVVIYQSIARMLRKEIRMQLLESSSILAKSAELEIDGVAYEWQEALESNEGTSIAGLFQFWDLKTGVGVSSPALEGDSLELFYGELNHPIIKPITLQDGRPALAVGLKLLPFLEAGTVKEMEKAGKFDKPDDFPQVLVCARETATLNEKLGRLKWHLFRAGSATLLTIWLSILAITMWTMKPIRELERRFEKRAEEDSGPLPEIPDELPVELRGLAEVFNRTLRRVEAARDRERDFAVHAAHELRTPIAGIQATLEQALFRDRPADDLRDRIANALMVTGDMRGTLQNLMKLARVRGRIEKIEIEALDPGMLVNELVEAERPRFEDRKLAVSAEYGGSIEGFASDCGLLKIVVTTLLDNVARHASEGTDADVRMDAEDGMFVLRITNVCRGLKADDVTRLFEPFQRGEFAGEGGAGLGLSLAKEIARLLGGEVKMDWKDDRVKVTLRLPSLKN